MVMDYYPDDPLSWYDWKSMMKGARTVQLRVPIPTEREGLYRLELVFNRLGRDLNGIAGSTRLTAVALPGGRNKLLSAERDFQELKRQWEEDFQKLYGEEIARERDSHFKLYEVARKEYKGGTDG